MHHIVTEAAISELVDSFYGKIRDDQLLGPIFFDAIGDNWGPHLAKMKTFWSSVILASRTYKGNPMMVHLQLPRLRRVHFERWLHLWRETVAEVCSEDVGGLFVAKAEMIGQRFLYAISMYHQSIAREEAVDAAPRAV